jgi:hypothetical protein
MFISFDTVIADVSIGATICPSFSSSMMTTVLGSGGAESALTVLQPKNATANETVMKDEPRIECSS